MTDVRESPSGPKLSVGGDVSSVFGRTGAVVAEDGDYDTDQVENVSTVPGVSASDALDVLHTSDGITNQSGVSGSTVTDALNTLLSSIGGGTGSFSESFCGGQQTSITATNANGVIGNCGWNYITSGTATGNSINFLPGEVGAVGIRRIISPTANGAFANTYLGALAAPIFDASNWAECTWRARVDTVQGANERCWFGVLRVPNNALGTDESAGFFSQLAGTGSSANYQTVTSHLGAGNTPQDTGVPVNASFHNFRMVHPDADTVQFYIDGVLRTTHSTANGDGIPTGALMPFGGARGGGASTFVDLDDFNFTAG